MENFFMEYLYRTIFFDEPTLDADFWWRLPVSAIMGVGRIAPTLVCDYFHCREEAALVDRQGEI
jgi:hypothetical protein